LTLDDYQERSRQFRVKASTPEERVFGLLEESGEVAGVFKRLFRGDYDDDVAADKLAKELGDVFWYLANICTDNGWKLSYIAQANLDKLTKRMEQGKLKGSGDDREINVPEEARIILNR
jgi:NTP pyrophosphatase (non-canonical NTP hydrolase)